MATRSTISILKKDKTVESIYCHWDGYPSNNGILLYFEYSSLDKVKKLISLGDLSNLDASLDNPEGHSYDNPISGCCVFYGRDRGEDKKDCEKRIYKSLEDLDEEGFDYVFDESDLKWYLKDGPNLIDLKNALLDDELSIKEYEKRISGLEKKELNKILSAGEKIKKPSL